MMKKVLGALALVTVLTGVLVIQADAADLANGNGQSCPAGYVGTYHFVNNQTAGAPAGELTAVFANPSGVYTTGPSKVLSKVQHFYVPDIGGTLVSATTGDLGGRLVLSDYYCTQVKKK